MGYTLNTVSTEVSFLEIVGRQAEGEKSVFRMEQVELRIRYLLDQLWRGKRSTQGAYVTPTLPPSPSDTGIDNPIICQWDRYMGSLNAEEFWVRYVVSYERKVPQ